MKRSLALAAVCLCACVAPLPQVGDEDVSFALMGDLPYNEREVLALDALIDQLNDADLAFVVHVGDIKSGREPCSDELLEARKRQFQRIRHPLVLLPGDNDWVDCHRSGFDPIERLNKMRQLFHSGGESIGQRTIRLERQSSDPRFSEYREHLRWTAGKVLFVGLNVQGSNNNLGRTAAMDAEYRARMAAVFAWLEDSVESARQRGLAGLVILIQADPDFELRIRRRDRVGDGYAEFRAALARLAPRFGKPMLLVHGDTHLYHQDQPLADPATGRTIANFYRVEVPGSPQVRWLRGGIRSAGDPPFAITAAPPPAPAP